ncbi:MAG: sigma-70 family RNA polymerase sigma factor, partial [Chitinophagaceae bacterium]|nr:sigma-70 family RNA polymerase sigma factor [Chitinophagaceae bacterium]
SMLWDSDKSARKRRTTQFFRLIYFTYYCNNNHPYPLLAAQPYNDQLLLERIARSDQEAFAQLFNQCRNRAYTLALTLLQSNVLAEETVQEVFLKLWVKRTDLPQIENIEAYITTMVRHRAFKTLKAIARYNIVLKDTEEADWLFNQQLQDLVQQKEFAIIVREAVDALPPQQKQAWRLNKEQQLPRNKVAEIMKLSPETVKVHLALAMRSIRAYCQARIELAIVLLSMICR